LPVVFREPGCYFRSVRLHLPHIVSHSIIAYGVAHDGPLRFELAQGPAQLRNIVHEALSLACASLIQCSILLLLEL
jgi:hypothetical protein